MEAARPWLVRFPAARYEASGRPRTRFGAAHLELNRLALVQAAEPVGKQVTLRRQTA
jgi:hypothetical protein